MQASLEQRYALNFFCVKMGNSASETLEMLSKAYRQATLSSAQVYRWHKAFKDGRESVEDEQRSGLVSSSKTQRNVDAVMSVLNRDRRLTVRMIAEELELAKTVVHEIVTQELMMRKVCAKLVPKYLSSEQKEHRQFVCRDLLDRLVTEPNFMTRVITGDKSWVSEYDPETKRQSSEWHTSTSPRPKKARMSKSRIK
jgi:hypothetical protein